jgi:predicted HicB family RNase H-like nuclease
MTVRLPPDVHRALKIYAAGTGRSMAEIIEELVRQRLA